MKRVDVRVTGRVQGVFFRESTRQKADEIGVRGTVRNDPDGSVSIRAEGTEEQLEHFLAWVRRGPGHARVEAVDVTEGRVEGFPSFEVKR